MKPAAAVESERRDFSVISPCVRGQHPVDAVESYRAAVLPLAHILRQIQEAEDARGDDWPDAINLEVADPTGFLLVLLSGFEHAGAEMASTVTTWFKERKAEGALVTLSLASAKAIVSVLEAGVFADTVAPVSPAEEEAIRRDVLNLRFHYGRALDGRGGGS